MTTTTVANTVAAILALDERESFKGFMARVERVTGVPFESIPIAAPGELPEGDILCTRKGVMVALSREGGIEGGAAAAAFVSPCYGKREMYQRFF